MLAPILAVIFAIIIGVTAHSVFRRDQRVLATLLLIVSFFLRLIVNATISRSVRLFSYVDKGGDSVSYQEFGEFIAKMWSFTGVHFVTGDEIPGISQVALVVNSYAFITYLNGEPTTLGCVALVAFIGCMVCIEVYRFATHIGASEKAAFLLAMIINYSPGFLFYTSDTYKDGFVVLFVLMSMSNCVRLVDHFTWRSLILTGACFLGLWHVRYYMVFMCALPLMAGLITSTAVSKRGRLSSFAMAITAGVLLALFSPQVGKFIDIGEQTFEHATSRNVIASNAKGYGSTVDMGQENMGPWGALPLKMLYTITSPFIWQGGGFGMQLGKIEVLGWYYILYRVYTARRRLWRENRRYVIIFTVFLIPSFVIYSTTFINVGLIFRQRIPLVVVTSILACLSWRRAEKPARVEVLTTHTPTIPATTPPAADSPAAGDSPAHAPLNALPSYSVQKQYPV